VYFLEVFDYLCVKFLSFYQLLSFIGIDDNASVPLLKSVIFGQLSHQ
jgi:hypothetical protein